MNPVHSNFGILLDIEKVLNKNIVYISDLTPDRSKWFKWVPSRLFRLVCYQSCTSLDMTRVLLKSRRAEAIFIFEHKPQYSLLLYLTCIFKNVPVFFIVHGIQQAQKKSIFHCCGGELLRLLVHRFKFWPIHIELSDRGVPGIRQFSRSIVMPHPLARESVFTSEKKKKRVVTSIGIVGMLRSDKPVMPIIKIALEYVKRHENVTLYVGTPFWQELPEELKRKEINLVDTTSKEQYFSFLKSLDVVIADFEFDSFFFRPSGIINDAISCKCFVIAPAYPVFEAQLNNPTKVGVTFKTLECLEQSIDKALDYIRTHNIDYDAWIEARSCTRIIVELVQRMKEIIDQKSKKKHLSQVVLY
jgi:hypothetical protein